MDWDPPDTWRNPARWRNSLSDSIGKISQAEGVISDRWEPKFTLTGSPHPPLIYDYYNTGVRVFAERIMGARISAYRFG